jgi:hypothetical protein
MGIVSNNVIKVELTGSQRRLVERARKLIQAESLFSEELLRAINGLELTLTMEDGVEATADQEFNFALGLLKNTVEDAESIK